ncbi:MAG: hypothetical protein ACYCW6_04030 [Candidatus Xenobia bacterium]
MRVWQMVILAGLLARTAWPHAMQHPPTSVRPLSQAVLVSWHPVAAPRPAAVVLVGHARIMLYGSSSQDVRDQAARLAGRLAVVAQRGWQLAAVKQETFSEASDLTWEGRVLWEMTPASARPYKLPAAKVVAAWVAALHMQRPVVSLPASVQVPLGESLAWRLPAGSKLKARTGNAARAHLSGRVVTVEGREPGVTTLVFSTGKVAVTVQPPAGTLPLALHLTTRGPADAEMLQAGLDRALAQGSVLQDGAKLWTSWDMLAHDRPLTVWAEGPGLASRVALLRPAIEHVEATLPPAGHLFASNNPERICEAGVLAEADLPSGTSFYYYHHHLASNGPSRLLTVSLRNDGDAAVHLWLTQSGAGPDADELYAGHVATWRFLRWEQQGEGWRVDLAPGHTYVLDRRFMAPNDVVAGMGSIEIPDGSRIHITVQAVGGGDPVPALAKVPLRARGIYSNPMRDVQGTYAVGGQYAFIDLGGPPYDQSVDALPNYGNYGCMYRIHIHLSNPTATSRKVYVVFAPGGGLARGSFQIEDKFIETPMVTGDPTGVRETPLASWSLDPGEQKDVEVVAIPEPGSNYPVRIVVKPVPAGQ